MKFRVVEYKSPSNLTYYKVQKIARDGQVLQEWAGFKSDKLLARQFCEKQAAICTARRERTIAKTEVKRAALAKVDDKAEDKKDHRRVKREDKEETQA